MKTKLVQMFAIVFVLGILPSGNAVFAQSDAMTKKSLEMRLELSNRLAPNRRMFFSSGKRNLLRAAQLGLNGGSIIRASLSGLSRRQLVATVLPNPGSSTTSDGLVAVSNSRMDFAISVLGGFQQSTSSSARCGNSVVVGFGDLEDSAQIKAEAQGFSPLSSVDGISVSSDGGQSFQDIGHIGFANVPANTDITLGGDPVVACSSANRFYYSALLDIVTFDQGE